MSLYKRGRSGTWWMVFIYNGIRYRRSTNTMDKKTAQKIHDSVRGRIAEKKWNLPEECNWTFKELTDRYMKEHSKIKKRSWRRDEISLAHLLPFFGECTLLDVTPEIISRYKARRYKEKAKPATLNRELTLAKHAFNLGLKEWGWCKENPFCKVKMERENNVRDRVLTHEEEERLLNACQAWLADIVTFAIDTGARMSEILDLTWKDADLFRRTVIIHQAKTGHMKTIPLTDTAFEVLKAKAKVRHLHTNLVFPSMRGTRRTNRNLQRAFYNARKKAGITGLRFHDLRHTFASRLVMAGKDLYLVQKLLGHREPRMVQRYAHHSVESLRDGIKALDSLRKEAQKVMPQNQPQASCQETCGEIVLDEKSKKSYGYELGAHSSAG